MYIYKTKYAPLHHSRNYTNAYIGIKSTCIHKGRFKNPAFVLARLAQLVKHQTSDLRPVGSSPNLRKTFFILHFYAFTDMFFFIQDFRW